MKATTTGFLLLLTVVAGVLGVLIRPGPIERTATPPVETPAAMETPVNETPALNDPGDWMAISPMRVKMRTMWLDCSAIVIHSTGEVIDLNEIETAAADIARKAGTMGDMWQAVRDQNRAVAQSSNRGEWFEAAYHAQRTWQACSNCHVENRSSLTQGFLPGSIETWHRRGYATPVARHSVPLSAPDKWVTTMFEMMRHHDRAALAVNVRDARQVLASTKAIDEEAQQQMAWLRGVERHAKQIAEAAAINRLGDIAMHYNRMTGYCVGCHARFVEDARRPLNPLSYPRTGE